MAYFLWYSAKFKAKLHAEFQPSCRPEADLVDRFEDTCLGICGGFAWLLVDGHIASIFFSLSLTLKSLVELIL